MRIGVVVLPEHLGDDGPRVWRRVEELGVDHGWTFDHLSWRTLRDRPWFDAMTTLAAAAVTTTRMTLGPLVCSPNFRHPVVTAKEAMTLDHLSGGRLVVGIGAGTRGDDAGALGHPPLRAADRADRFEEFVDLLDRLLRTRTTTAHGRFYEAVDVPMVPGCVQRPRAPFAVAAAGPRGMRLAARQAAIWVTIGDPDVPGEQPVDIAFRTLREQSRRMDEACAAVGRDPADLRRLVNLSRVVAEPYGSAERFADLVGRCGELGFTDAVVVHPRSEGVFAGDPDRFERAVAGAVERERADSA